MLFLLGGLLTAPCDIHPVYALVPKVSAIRVVRIAARYRASTTISFGVKQTREAVIPSVETGLLDHVRGHEIVAHRVARSSNGHLEANGASAAQAKARLQRTIHDLTADQNSELLREERAYDNVTENGASQSQGPAYGFPGGPDVQDAACTR